METFTASECIRFGWETFKKRPWFLIGAMIVYWLASWLVSAVFNAIGNESEVIKVLSTIASWLVTVLLSMGYAAFLLKAHDDVEHVSLYDLWHPQPYLKYLGMMILTTIVVGIGFLLLIVPGIILALMFMFTQYVVIEQNADPIEAMKESKRLTDGHKGTLFLLALMSLGLIIIGAVCLLVGVLVAGPVVMLAMVHAYRLLQRRIEPMVVSSPTGTV